MSTFSFFGYQGKKTPKEQTVKDPNAPKLWEKIEIDGDFPPIQKHSLLSISEDTIVIIGQPSDKPLDPFVRLLKPKVNTYTGGSFLKTTSWQISLPKLLNPLDAPPPTRGNSAIYYKGKVILFGGKYENDNYGQECSGDLWVLYTAIWEWSKINFGMKTTPIERFNHTAVRCGDRMIVFGGIADSLVKGKILNDLWEFDIDSQDWKEIQKIGITPPERHSHSATAVFDHLMIIYGGTSKENKSTQLGDCWMLNTHTWVWQPLILSGKVPGQRFGHCMTNIGNGFVMIHGGYNGKFLRDTFVIDLQNRKCIHVDIDKDDECEERKAHAMTMIDTKAIFIGGAQKQKIYNDAYQLDCEKLKFNTLMPEAQASINKLENLLRIPSEAKMLKRDTSMLHRVSTRSDLSTEYDENQESAMMQTYRNSIPCFSLDIEDENEKFVSSFLLTEFVKGNLRKSSEKEIIDKDIKKNIGNLYFKAGQYVKCITFLTKHIDEVYPKKDVEGLEIRGRAYFILGDYEKSLADLSEIPLANRQDIVVLRAECLMNLERYEEALTFLEKIFMTDKSPSIKSFLAQTQNLEQQYIKIREGRTHSISRGKSMSEIKKSIQVYVSGGPGSGKTTFMQQLSIMFKKSLSPKECANYRKNIQQEVLDNVKVLLRVIESLDLKFESDKNHPIGLEKYEKIDPVLFQMLLNFTNDKVCHIALKSKDSCPEHGNLVTPHGSYFLSHAERILSDDYVPIPTDVLYLSSKTSTRNDNYKDLQKFGIKTDEISESLDFEKDKTKSLKFRYREVDFSIREVITGSKPTSLSTKTESIIVWMVPLDDLDKKKPEEHQRKLDRFQYTDIVRSSPASAAAVLESMYQFDLMCNAPNLKDINVVLLFTKNSIFEQKLANGIDVSSVFPDYKGGKNIKKNQDFLINVFKKLNVNKKRQLYPFFMDCTEKRGVLSGLKWLYDCLIAQQTKDYLKEQGML